MVKKASHFCAALRVTAGSGSKTERSFRYELKAYEGSYDAVPNSINKLPKLQWLPGTAKSH
jgi:hypothetical protein